MVLLFNNIVEGAPWNLPYDFDAVHFGPDPFNVYFISFTTSDRLNFTALNIAYIGEAAGIIVFIPFGTTPEALNMYREMLLSLGLGYAFPRLREEYVPRESRSNGTWFSWSSLSCSLRGKNLLGTRYTSFIDTTAAKTPLSFPVVCSLFRPHYQQLDVHPQRRISPNNRAGIIGKPQRQRALVVHGSTGAQRLYLV